jgi:hypothetical protein
VLSSRVVIGEFGDALDQRIHPSALTAAMLAAMSNPIERDHTHAWVLGTCMWHMMTSMEQSPGGVSARRRSSAAVPPSSSSTSPSSASSSTASPLASASRKLHTLSNSYSMKLRALVQSLLSMDASHRMSIAESIRLLSRWYHLLEAGICMACDHHHHPVDFSASCLLFSSFALPLCGITFYYIFASSTEMAT